MLACHPQWVKPDFASGDRRFASVLGLLERHAPVDLIQLGVPPGDQSPERTAVLRQYFRGQILPDQERAGERALRSRLYKAGIFEFWPVAEHHMPTLRETQPWAAGVVDSVDVHFVREEAAAALGLMDPQVVAANKRRELEVYARADGVIVVTEDDRKALLAAGLKTPVYVVPNVVPLQERPERERAPEVLFVGGFSHAPNADGLLWFMRECWAPIREQVPEATLTVVGSNATAPVRALAGTPGVRVEGYVPTTGPYLERAAVSIAPLRYGGGMKGKVCEALAAGMPLVSTTAGVSGLMPQHRVHAWVADDPAGFVQGVVTCLRDPKTAAEMGRKGRELVAGLCGEAAVEACVVRMLEGLGPRVPTAAQWFAWRSGGVPYWLRLVARRLLRRSRPKAHPQHEAGKSPEQTLSGQ